MLPVFTVVGLICLGYYKNNRGFFLSAKNGRISIKTRSIVSIIGFNGPQYQIQLRNQALIKFRIFFLVLGIFTNSRNINQNNPTFSISTANQYFLRLPGACLYIADLGNIFAK